MMRFMQNDYKVVVGKYERTGIKRTVFVDLRRVVGMHKPLPESDFFEMYFDNAIWLVDVKDFENVNRLWMEL